MEKLILKNRIKFILNAKVSIITIAFILISTVASSQFCNKYADKAVAQYKLAKKNNLPNINWPVWSDDWKGHYNWCKTVSEDAATKQTVFRDSYLKKYIKELSEFKKGYRIAKVSEFPDPTKLIGLKERISEEYAKKAVHQNKENISNGCGFKGPEWSSDHNAHKNWCLHGDNYLKADQVLAKRESQLKKCSGNSNNIKVGGAILNVDPSDIVFENNTDRPGKNYKKFDITEAYEFNRYNKCLQACVDDPKCKSFTFVKSNTPGGKDQCFLKNDIPNPVLKENYVSGVVRPESKNDYCKIYASNAIYSATTNIQNNCGNKGNRWSNNYKSHYDFCMKVPVSRSKQEASERNRLLAICNKPTKTGDLMAFDMCYNIDFSNGKITFYPLIKNVGLNDWRSEKEGQYIIYSKVGRITREPVFKLPYYPSWSLKKGETYQLQGVSFDFSSKNIYSLEWKFWHDEDTNKSNNGINKPFESFGNQIKGVNFAEHPWLLSHKKCVKDPVNWALNLIWDSTDLNNIPLNPKTEWQIKHKNFPNYYPDISELTPLIKTRIIKIRYWGIVNVKTMKLGEERDFLMATNQSIFREYGGAFIPKNKLNKYIYSDSDIDVSDIIGKCGPHVNWKQPVTYEGNLVGGKYDQDDKDLNFYLYTSEGSGASKSSSHEGGLKVEFNRFETIDHLSNTSPWWSSNKSKFLSKNTLDQIIDGTHTYAIVTGMYGYDCAHECHSELHPAWTMAALVKDDPNDDIYAIFARNWGNEGFCSDHIFHLDLPKKDNQYIYKFFLRWRPGAESVVLKPIFNQVGGVTLDITSIPQKGVIVSFGFPSPDIKPFIIGELHLTWKYQTGVSPRPYSPLKNVDKNASTASKVIVLEDSEMVDDIIKNLPQDKKYLYRKYIDEVNKIQPEISLDESKPEKLILNRKATERISSKTPEVQIIKNMDIFNRKKTAVKKLSIDKE